MKKKPLGDKELLYKLIELFDSEYGNAIREYNRKVDMGLLSAIAIGDPFKDPTTITRNQGVRIGLYNLENYVSGEKARIAKEAVPKKAKKGPVDGKLY